jgi:hypothetical protein
LRLASPTSATKARPAHNHGAERLAIQFGKPDPPTLVELWPQERVAVNSRQGSARAVGSHAEAGVAANALRDFAKRTPHDLA